MPYPKKILGKESSKLDVNNVYIKNNSKCVLYVYVRVLYAIIYSSIIRDVFLRRNFSNASFRMQFFERNFSNVIKN